MTKNKIKLLAAATMFIDHMGIILFPEVIALRWIGRLSFPLYAFCIGDGCRYTKQPRKYFLRIFLLGLGCQIAFAVEELLISHVRFPGEMFYFNVLFTFSFSVLLCIQYLKIKREEKGKSIIGFILLLLLIVSLNLIFAELSERTGYQILFDYKTAGMILPLFAVIADDKKQRLAIFSVGVVLFALLSYQDLFFIAFTIAVIPILWLYNEKPGKKGFKYGFYLFYPAQFAILYFIAKVFFS